MAFTKIIKTASYYKRFQLKPKRRRQAITDYQARRNLIRQDLNKYNVQKYRFVVRFTNTRTICQVIIATMDGDRVLESADSNDLKAHGLDFGQNNYAASYATGLLCARRCLKKLGMDSMIVGKVNADGEDYHVEDEEHERTPFKAVLDIGLTDNKPNNRVFGAMKGAVDGGMHIPHSHKCFPGFVRGVEGAEDSYDPTVHHERIFGLTNTKRMERRLARGAELQDGLYKRYVENKITSENVESVIRKVHQSIRSNPDRPSKEGKPVYRSHREGDYMVTPNADGTERRLLRPLKLTPEQRRERKLAKMAEIAKLAQAALEGL